MSVDFFVTFSMIFEDNYEHSINRQEYDNKQRKNHKEEKMNRTKFVVEAMTINLACIIILLCLFFRYRIAGPWKYSARGRNRTFWYLTRVRCVEPLRYLWQQIGDNMYVYRGYLPLVLFEYRPLGKFERIEKYFKIIGVGKIKRLTVMDNGDLIICLLRYYAEGNPLLWEVPLIQVGHLICWWLYYFHCLKQGVNRNEYSRPERKAFDTFLG